MVKRHPKFPCVAVGISLIQDKPISLKKTPVRDYPSRISSHHDHIFHPSFLSPERSDDSGSPEPEVLDLRIKRNPHQGFLFAPSLQSLLQSIPSSPSLSLPSSISAAVNKSNNLHSKFVVHQQQENVSKNRVVLPPKKSFSKKAVKRKSTPTPASKTTSVKKSKVSVLKKMAFDEHKSSPVSGTFILDSDAEDDEVAANMGIFRRNGDIDPSLNVVIETEEAREELSKIDNKIGDYNCCLCKQKFVDAFRLASHRCPRIVHIEYRCTECDKVFNCPANLASHRRWHKPRDGMTNGVKKTTIAPLSDCEEQSPPTTAVFIGRNP